MDLSAETTRLQLDLLAVRLGETLEAGGIPYALIKGPSTSLWLYDPPRRYSDVDVLVPRSRARDAAGAFEQAGLAVARSGGIGEEAPHSLLMHSTEGFEVDLHVSLPAVPPDGDRIWVALAAHREPLVIDVGTVTALDEVGRCLVLALHAVGNPRPSQAVNDLVRARARTSAATWEEVHRLAESLDVDDLVTAGVADAEGRVVPLSRRAHLYLTGAPAAAIGLQRLMDARWRDRPAMVRREVLPTRGFMAAATGDPGLHGAGLLAAHLHRWRRLTRQLPAAMRSGRPAR